MSLQVGQYRGGGSISKYLSTPIRNFSYKEVVSTVNNYHYSNTSAQTAISGILQNNVYYIKIIINNFSGNATLFAEDTTGVKQTLGIFNIKDSMPIETIFTLKLSNVKYFVIQSNNNVNTEQVTIEVAKVINILSNEINQASLKRIGFQANSNQLVCINGNPIRINNSGLFSLSDENLLITFVGVILQQNSDSFIIDYQY